MEGLLWINDPILPIDSMAADSARRRQDQLTKPRGSLGRLEEMAIKLAGMQGASAPSPDPVHILQFMSDHGVAAEGVSLYPQEVTIQMMRNIAHGGAAVSVMAEAIGARMEIIDLGILTDPGPVENVRSERLGFGTGNIAREPAMSEEQLVAAMNAGRSGVERALSNGARLLICGEMGIGNTTPATAVACALLDKPVVDMVGPGTGLNAEGINRKRQAIESALALHLEPGRSTLDLLARLGGFDIVATTGAYITAAQRGLPILVDGFIMSAAALAAVRLQPEVRNWMIFSHTSAEPGHRLMMEALDADPYLDLGMRLGEATGGEALVPLLRLACVVHQRMATFSEAGVTEV